MSTPDAIITYINNSDLLDRDKAALRRMLGVINKLCSEMEPWELAAARAYAGLSRSQAAREIGISLQELDVFERGERVPSMDIASRMSQVYGVAKS